MLPPEFAASPLEVETGVFLLSRSASIAIAAVTVCPFEAVTFLYEEVCPVEWICII